MLASNEAGKQKVGRHTGWKAAGRQEGNTVCGRNNRPERRHGPRLTGAFVDTAEQASLRAITTA